MAKKFAEWRKWTIPSDWNEERDGYMCYVLCVPNSRQWRGIFDGQVSDLAYGRNWNRNTGSIIDNQEIARGIFESMCAQQCDDIIAQITLIAEGMIKLGDKTEVAGQEVEAPSSEGEVTVGEGEQFPDQESYFNAKCNVANSIFDTLLGMVDWMVENNVDLLAGLFGGITSGLILALIAAGPVGWASTTPGSVFSGIASYLVRFSISFADLQDALLDVHEECVLALFNASNTIVAENSFISVLEGATPEVTEVESDLLRLVMSSDMINQLFSPRGDIAQYQSPSPIDCGSALLAVWSFVASGQSWVFRDDSTSSYSASGVWSSSSEAWAITLIGSGTPKGPAAIGTVLITGLSIAVPENGSIQADYSDTGDGLIISITLKAIFSDLTEQEVSIPGEETAGTIVMTIAAAKTLSEIEVTFGRNSTASFNTTQDVEEVRVFGI